MTIHELTQNKKYKFWYLKIKECKESDLSVQDFCERNNIKTSTYYKYQQKIKMILCDHIKNETELKNEVAFIPVDKQVCNSEKIIIIKGSIRVEFYSNTLYYLALTNYQKKYMRMYALNAKQKRILQMFEINEKYIIMK